MSRDALPDAPRPGLVTHLTPLAAMLAATVLVTWPTAPSLGEAIPGHPTGDIADHVWGQAWFVRTLAGGELPLRTDASHMPSGGAFWFIDPLGALMAWPFQAFGPAVATSMLVLLQVILAMAGVYALAWTATRARGAATVVAIAVGASPYVLGLLHTGVLEQLHLGALASAWLSVRSALSTGTRRGVLVAGGLVALVLVASTYLGVFLAALVTMDALAEPSRLRERAGRLLAVAALATLLAGPWLALAWGTLHAPDAVVRPMSAPGWNPARLPATDLAAVLLPGDRVFPDLEALGNPGVRHVTQVGTLLPILGALGAWSVREDRRRLALALILAAGPVLCWDGQVTRIPLPSALLYLPGSPFSLLHHPYRWVAVLLLVLAVPATRTLARAPRWILPFLALALAESLFASGARWPVPTMDARVPTPVTRLAGDVDVRGVWSFPPGGHVENRRWELLAATHAKAMPYGVNSVLPDRLADNDLARSLLRCLRALPARLVTREREPPPPSLLASLRAPVREDDLPRARDNLRALGFDTVLLHLDALEATEADCARGVLQRGGDALLDRGDTVERWGRAPSQGRLAP